MSNDAWGGLDRKLVAILRGIRREETEAVVSGLLAAGFRAIEVPLNSPDPFRSIEIAVRAADGADGVLIGAGTVLTPADVGRVGDCGGRLIVSPNTDVDVIRATVCAGHVSLPGCFTATEALLALKAGAAGLKVFPASLLGPGGVKALAAVLPDATPLCAVGGVSDRDFAAFMAAGVDGFGLGSSLYKPGDAADAVIARGKAAVVAYDAAVAGGLSSSRNARSSAL